MNKRMGIIVTAMTGACLLTGCAENQTRIGEGAGVGGLLGAAAGGIIGHQSGHGWQGALIGGAAGAAGGAMVGSQIEKPRPVETTQTTTTTAVTTAGGTLTMQQIVDMAKSGVSSDAIITQIQTSHSTYVLTAEDVGYLRTNGVSQRVIEAMQAAR